MLLCYAGSHSPRKFPCNISALNLFTLSAILSISRFAPSIRPDFYRDQSSIRNFFKHETPSPPPYYCYTSESPSLPGPHTYHSQKK